MITVSQIWNYPFKSGKGQTLTSVQVESEGLSGDRRLVAVDENGVFITARKHSQLLQLSCIRAGSGWLLQHPSEDSDCQILEESLASHLEGLLWKDSFRALDAGDEAAEWLSTVLNKKVRIAVWEKRSRFSNKYQLQTSFSDASPILVASEASIRQACDWGGVETDTRRFRPNIVVDGIEAFEEDSWSGLRIGGVNFTVLDACVRCVLTTIQPDTGERHPERQPMVALMKNHATENGQPLFGMNITPAISSGERAVIALGDEVIATSGKST